MKHKTTLVDWMWLTVCWGAFLLLWIILSGCSTTQLHTASNALLVADWAQTRYIADNPDRYYETNPLLGEHPSLGKVNRHFVGALVINNAMFYALPEEYAKAWGWGVVAVEGWYVGSNANIGVRMKF